MFVICDDIIYKLKLWRWFMKKRVDVTANDCTHYHLLETITMRIAKFRGLSGDAQEIWVSSLTFSLCCGVSLTNSFSLRGRNIEHRSTVLLACDTFLSFVQVSITKTPLKRTLCYSFQCQSRDRCNFDAKFCISPHRMWAHGFEAYWWSYPIRCSYPPMQYHSIYFTIPFTYITF